MTDRRPPLDAHLKFARYNRTGRVHIRVHIPEPDDTDFDPEDVPFNAETLMNALRAPAQMLCGQVFLVSGFDGHPGTWIAGDDFPDDDLCFRCVQAMGDQSWRVFHVDNRGSAGAGE